MTLISDSHTTVVLEPADQPLHLPAALVPPELSPILGLGLGTVGSVRSYHLDALRFERRIKRIGVVRLVTDEPLGSTRHKPCLESVMHKGDLMRRSTLNVYGEWKTSSVCNHHDLCTLAPLGLSNAAAPFFATTKVPSMKHSDKSMSARSSKSRANACSTLSSTPERTHCWYRRWHVWYGGYLGGKSIQGAPVRSIQRMPSSTSLLLRQGLPRPILPSARRGGFGISGSKTAHCSSVSFNSCLLLKKVIPFSVGYL
jgi:hypothetical protein